MNTNNSDCSGHAQPHQVGSARWSMPDQCVSPTHLWTQQRGAKHSVEFPIGTTDVTTSKVDETAATIELEVRSHQMTKRVCVCTQDKASEIFATERELWMNEIQTFYSNIICEYFSMFLNLQQVTRVTRHTSFNRYGSSSWLTSSSELTLLGFVLNMSANMCFGISDPRTCNV